MLIFGILRCKSFCYASSGGRLLRKGDKLPDGNIAGANLKISSDGH